MAFFQPHATFRAYYELTPAYLVARGITVLLLDIDNTLAPYEQEFPDQKTIDWFKNLAENGIKAALISNNKPERIEKYNVLLALPAYPDSKKPSTKAILRAIEQMGVTVEVTAGLGDQLLTDTLAVHRLDMISLIVPPIKDKKTPFFRFKRLLEKPFIARYYKKSKAKEDISK